MRVGFCVLQFTYWPLEGARVLFEQLTSLHHSSRCSFNVSNWTKQSPGTNKKHHWQPEILLFWDSSSHFINYKSTGSIPDLVKKFLPNFCQWSFMISSTLCFLVAKIDNHASTAHKPSFSRIWSEPGRLAEGEKRGWVIEGHCFH